MPEVVTPDSIAEVRALVEARILEEQELLSMDEGNPAPAGTPDQEELTPELVRQCLANNKRGDGILYSLLARDRFIYAAKLQEWYQFSTHYWEPDIGDVHLREVERVAITYKDEADALQPQIESIEEELFGLKGPLKAANKAKKDAEKSVTAAVKAGEGLPAAEQSYDAAQEAQQEIVDRAAGLSTKLGNLISQQKAYHRRIDSLRKINGATECAEWSTIVDNPLRISGDELDQQPWLLPCANGVIDLQTGELRPGQPGDWLSKAIPIEYKGFYEPAPEWEKFLDSIQPDKDVLDFLSPLFGYGITGLSVEQFITVFIGPGRNGKGLMFEMLEMVMGPLYWAIQSELLLENKNARSSAGASPDIVALKGRRICAASETDQGRRIGCAKIKELTGSDTLNGRSLYDKHDANFRPTHKLFLRSQHVPEGLTKDFALRERLILITFPFRFVDNPEAKALEDTVNAEFYRLKDRGLKDRLVKELPGILSWLVRGCARWIADGKLKPPKSVLLAVEALHQAEDYVGRFLAECVTPASADTFEVYGPIYEAFKTWYCEEECIDPDGKEAKFIPSSKSFARALKEKGYHSPPKDQTGGTKRVYGLQILSLFR